MNPPSFAFKQNQEKASNDQPKGASNTTTSVFGAGNAAGTKVSFSSLFGKASGSSDAGSPNSGVNSLPPPTRNIRERGDFEKHAARLNIPKSAFSPPPRKPIGSLLPTADKSKFRLNNRENPSAFSQNPFGRSKFKYVNKAAEGPGSSDSAPLPPPPINPLDPSRFKFKPVREKEAFEHQNPFAQYSLPSKPLRPAKETPLFRALNPRKTDSVFEKSNPIKLSSIGHDETDEAAPVAVPRPEFSASKMFGVELAKPVMKPLIPSSDSDKPPARFEENSDGKLWRPYQKSNQPRMVPMKTRSSPGPRAGSEENALLLQLEQLIGRECPGEYEKYSLLDERDKLIYKLREIGSPLISRLERCSEMCTEKERYMRIVQKRASPFECDEETNEVSHEVMVKEYARSAADQERPLPHELRSEKMMNYTMSYLLHNVLDKFPDTVEQRTAWYNFLWSRTRAVRKEVTQLSMSDTLALNLVERCTRLHILFGYILCTLETDHFDQKMNNETLGKCLQTLRHLYEDFERRGIVCENEAEFRSYDVMLHVNDTNVLSQVLSYRSEVRQSKHVCLALQLASSVQNNNYIKFFRLLKRDATFLQCCVSHKTFDQMRANALTVMTVSYGRNATYPIEKLKNSLAFDSIEEATATLRLFGICSESEPECVLIRDYLTLVTVPMKTYQWIDAKRKGNFSQVVFGPETFHFFNSRCDISISFDNYGRYSNDKVLNDILPESTGLKTGNDALKHSMQMTIENKRQMDEERHKRELLKRRDDLILRLTNNVIDQVVMGYADEERMKYAMIRRQKKAIEEKRKAQEEERRRAEIEMNRKQMEEALAKKIAENVEKQAVEIQLKKYTQNEIMKERKRKEQKIAEKLVEKLWQKKVMKAVDNHVMNICVEMIENKKFQEELDEFKKKVAKRRVLKLFKLWRVNATRQMIAKARARRQDMLMKCAPIWDSKEVGRDLIRRYTNKEGSPRHKSSGNVESVIRLTAMQKIRKSRISRDAIRKWRQFAVEKRELKKIAKQMKENEDTFFARFNKGDKIKHQFSFKEPTEFSEHSGKSRRSSTPTLDHSTYLEEASFRMPFREVQPFSVFSQSKFLKPSCSEADLSLIVARDQIDRGGWKGIAGMPMELKEKLKRRRESLEAEKNEHSQKRNKQERELIADAKIRKCEMDELTKTTNSLLEETLKFTEDLKKMMDELTSRKVADL